MPGSYLYKNAIKLKTKDDKFWSLKTIAIIKMLQNKPDRQGNRGKLGRSSPSHGTERRMALPQVSAAVPALRPHWQLWTGTAISKDLCPSSPIKETSDQACQKHLRGKQTQGISHWEDQTRGLINSVVVKLRYDTGDGHLLPMYFGASTK